MDVKRPLLTQVPSQTDVGIKRYDYRASRSSRIDLRIEFDGCEEATFEPSSVSNRCWDQKLAHILYPGYDTTTVQAVQAESVFELSLMDVKRPLLTQVPSQTDVGIKRYDYLVRRFKTNRSSN
eukprot:scaffold29289_cov58-Attheya_sp.AAC.2